MERKYKIAIVDDEQGILDLFTRYFETKDMYDISTFTNPITAINSIDHTYDLILLDIMMPQMSGLDALEEIMSIYGDQKVIMMTAYSTLDSVNKSYEIGASHYITKPFGSLEVLEEKILNIIGTKEFDYTENLSKHAYL